MLRGTKAASTHSGHTEWVKALLLSALSEPPSELSWVFSWDCVGLKGLLPRRRHLPGRKQQGRSRYRSNCAGSPSVALKGRTLGRTLVSSSATGSGSGLQSPGLLSLPPQGVMVYILSGYGSSALWLGPYLVEHVLC